MPHSSKQITTLHQCGSSMNSASAPMARSARPPLSIHTNLVSRGFLFLEWERGLGQASSKKKRRNSNAKSKTLSRADYIMFVFPWLLKVFGVHPRHPPRAFPLGLRVPRCLCAGKQNVQTAQIPGNEPFGICPHLLGERKFPLPGSGSPPAGGVCPRHPHSSFFNIVFGE